MYALSGIPVIIYWFQQERQGNMDAYCAKLMEFEKFLIDNRIVLKDKAKYYVNWADKFLHGINYRAEAIDQRTISSFLNSMSKDNRYEDWQIRQAENAVRMYVTNFLKMSLRPQVQEKSDTAAQPVRLSWEEAVLKYKECLRLRHYSYSTEKTYLECIGKFADYIRKDNVLVKLMYGCGLRLNECMRLRVNSIDFERGLLHIRAAKGDKDRMVPMPVSLRENLKAHLERLKELHAKDILIGYGEVHMPEALDRKYPNASKQLGWQWFFPMAKPSVAPRSGKVIQELLGHNSLETTMIYTHVAQKKLTLVESPLDRLGELGSK
jgi:integrase